VEISAGRCSVEHLDYSFVVVSMPGFGKVIIKNTSVELEKTLL
jgi:hypothetical protein